MARYLARRLAFALVLVFVVSSASLVLISLAPGDYAITRFPEDRGSIQEVRSRYGLDRSIAVQYFAWLANATRFDFGRSFQNGQPVSALVAERGSNTLLIAVTALFVATLIGIPLGTMSGTRVRGFVPAAARVFSLLLLSMPPLLTSIVLVFAAAQTGLFPIGGMRSATGASAGSVLDVVHHMVIPVLALALPIAALFERLQAQAIRDTLEQPFVVATLARGVPAHRVIWHHAMRVAVRPVVSIYGLVVGSLLSGSFAVEMITAWPGLGRLMFDALRARDTYLVAGCAAAGAAFLAVGTLLSDAALAFADPRTRE